MYMVLSAAIAKPGVWEKQEQTQKYTAYEKQNMSCNLIIFLRVM
jgi:hypothetical protein